MTCIEKEDILAYRIEDELYHYGGGCGARAIDLYISSHGRLSQDNYVMKEEYEEDAQICFCADCDKKIG